MDMKKSRKKEDSVACTYSIRNLEHHLVLACKSGSDSEEKLRSYRVELVIPKHITTSGETYIRRCLELIHDYAVRGSSWDFSKVHACLVDSESGGANAYDRASFVVKSPISSRENSITGCKIGRVTGSRRIRLRLAEFNASISDIGDPIHCDSVPAKLRYMLSGEPEKLAMADDYTTVVAAHFGSSMNIDKDSVSSNQGTIQSKWKDGVPYHVFSVEGNRDVYTACASKVEASKDRDLVCVYTFYAGKKDPEATKIETVATMRVFTSISVCSLMEHIKETKFILYASGDHHNEGNLHSNKGSLRRKMATALRPGNFMKQQSVSRSSGKSVILEDTSVSDHSEEAQIPARKNEAPGHEIAAIVLRETFQSPKSAKVGGWGLKFLKKPKSDPSLETTESSASSRNNGGCSTSMNVLIPAGIHGRSKAGSSGPSSLIERWISGGGCDCGGWDLGCPLTVLAPKQGNSDYTSQQVHLFAQDSRQDTTPVLKMENIRDGFYNIHFQSRLSNLQSFAIAAAAIHAQIPELNCS